MSLLRRRSKDEDEPRPADGAPQISDLNPAEAAWLDELREVLAQGAGPLEPAMISDLFDAMLDDWLATPVPKRPDPNSVINAIGVALGDAVCARVPGARWVVVADPAGTDLAIVLPPQDVTVFPTSSVAKRWTAGERGWIPDFIDGVAGHALPS
jgi:hypothetical protein